MKKPQIAIFAIGLAAAMSASAAVTTTFGPLPAANFGGVGNPNNAVEVTTITGLGSGSTTITLGLEGQQRYANPALGNNGNGTYTAGAGANYGGSPPLLGALWNFDFYASIAGGNMSQYSFALFYQLTPGGTMGEIYLNNVALAGGSNLVTTTTLQDSENLDFASLATSILSPIPLISAPPGPFNPNAIGDYSFTLKAYADSTFSGTPVGTDTITVDVIPEPTTIIAGASMLLPFGSCALRMLRKKVAA